jgi:predicted nucleic acid-binding protein
VTGYVLDASVAAKWVLPSQTEPLSAEAMDLLDRFVRGRVQLSVPDLFWVELGNIMWKASRVGRLSSKAVIDRTTWLFELDIPTFETKPLAEDALNIALEFNRTVYDSVYIALAVRSARPLVTADERLANATAVRLPVKWLGSALP